MSQFADVLPQVRSAIADDPLWTRLFEQARGVHIAILNEPFLTYILEGRKTIESRFSKNRGPPFERVRTDDLVLLKRSSGPVVGVAHVERAEFLTLDETTWPRVRALSEQLCADNSFWLARADKHYASLLYVKEVRQFHPFKIDKTDRRGWVVLRELNPIGVGQPCLL
jgi:hypothetical protein